MMSSIPPFCPNPDCPLHFLDFQSDQPSNRWYYRIGSYRTSAFGAVPRFRCLACRRTFSRQTFSIDYYSKRIVPYPALMQQLISGSNLRAISRHFTATTSTVSNKLQRLARQAMTMHNELIANLTIQEHFVADGFEAYTRSKYFPENIHLLAGKHSQFLYFFNQVTIRRKGRMTEAQKATCRDLYRHISFPHKAIEDSFTELLDLLHRFISGSSYPECHGLFTDEKIEYRRALRRHRPLLGLARAGLFFHHTTPSTDPRTISNNLFSVNYFDRELRKDLAAYHKKTVCFPRNINSAMGRLAVYFCYHNYRKHYRITNENGTQQVHGQVAGIERQKIDQQWRHLFLKRRFLSRVTLDDFSRKIWLRKLKTPLNQRTEYVPAYVLM